ncbi:hypothetical protein DTO212C5_4243 [Paecilomyces variotii]|nr:hypothetical protein DTO212C5_4243 [Paecilomyces variotii]
MSTLRPDATPRFCAVGRTTGTQADLEGMEFLTSCPPDVPPRSRILGLCGITDWEGLASPQEDGWFFSDFYLFHHLLSVREGPSTNQCWLTCEDPKDLVDRYTEYTHGNPKKDRRVVLDKDILLQIAMAGNLRVVQREDLLERFLSTLREQAQLAVEAEEHLLIFLFGHGNSGSYGIFVGGKGDPEKAPELHMSQVKRLLPKKASVTIVMTSCFSGGWLVKPDFANNRNEYLNVTGLAAVGPEQESRSWPISASIGRVSGSIAATAILESLISVETVENPEEEPRQHPTYIGLAHSIFETLNKIDDFAEENGIHFSAQNDEWEAEYRTRLGLPLQSYKDRWECLRKIPPSGNQESAEGPVMKTGSPRKRRRLRVAASGYLSSYPGRDNLAGNVGLHGHLRRFLRNHNDFDSKKIDRLFNQVAYRIAAMHEANELRKHMGIQFPSIFEFSVENWNREESARRRTGESSSRDELYSRVLRLLATTDVLARPIGCGHYYTKPWYYLGIAIIDTGMDWSEIQTKLATAVSKREARNRNIYHAWRGRRVAMDKDVISHRQAFIKAMKDMGRKVKELVVK